MGDLTEHQGAWKRESTDGEERASECRAIVACRVLVGMEQAAETAPCEWKTWAESRKGPSRGLEGPWVPQQTLGISISVILSLGAS